MEIKQYSLKECEQIRGGAVVVDVIRAFTTAAYAFAAGAEKIVLAATVEEVLEIQRSLPGALAMGEVGGMPVEGFALWNSPVQLQHMDLSGKTLVQRTSAGTQGAVRTQNATHMAVGSFVVASATVRLVRSWEVDSLGFVITGSEANSGGYEDAAFADYAQALLEGHAPDAQPYLQRGLRWRESYAHLQDEWTERMLADLALCLEADRFDFAMPVQREDGLLVVRRTPSGW